MKILFLGDIVGRPGRKTVAQVLPDLLKTKKPDFVLANAENLAGGKGITPATLAEMKKLGVDGFTGGNHIFKNPLGFEALKESTTAVCIPANFPEGVPGKRWSIFESESGKRLLVISVLGRTYMSQQVDCPFRTIDKILDDIDPTEYDASLVDVHAEATSEKYALKSYLDGRISVVVGTHTHVPTADADVTAKGTAFQADVGMNGSLDSCIGTKSSMVIHKLMSSLSVSMDLEKKGRMQFNAVLVTLLKDGTARSIQPLRTITSLT